MKHSQMHRQLRSQLCPWPKAVVRVLDAFFVVRLPPLTHEFAQPVLFLECCGPGRPVGPLSGPEGDALKDSAM